MTGFLSTGFNPLSRLTTIGGLQDLGDQVDYSAADAYSRPSGLAAQSAKPLSLNGEIQNVDLKSRSQ